MKQEIDTMQVQFGHLNTVQFAGKSNLETVKDQLAAKLEEAGIPKGYDGVISLRVNPSKNQIQIHMDFKLVDGEMGKRVRAVLKEMGVNQEGVNSQGIRFPIVRESIGGPVS